MPQRSPKQQIKHFLATGDSESLPANWPGENWLIRAQSANRALRLALVEEVQRRSDGLVLPSVPDLDYATFTRQKVSPMVNGLFPASERDVILKLLEKSVVFVTAENVLALLEQNRLRTSWMIANLYLGSIGAQVLCKESSYAVGLSEETTCFVSHEYFQEQNQYADFVVHEAAHVFHNNKRATVGLPETRTREFLLNIDFNQRETFAYACEVYSRLLESAGNSRTERIRLSNEIKDDFVPPDDSVDRDRFYGAISAACEARNGWKTILDWCSPPKRVRKREYVR